MDKTQMQQRAAALFFALQFSSKTKQILKVGERMMVNQERAQILYVLGLPEKQQNAVKLRPVSATIEAKLTEINRLMAVYDWRPLNQDELNDY